MRILGIDPGLRVTGWGVIDSQGGRLRHVANGACRSEGADIAERLCSLHDQLEAVIARHAPTHAAVEQTFVNRDGAGTLKLGQARGVAVLTLARAGLPVGEHMPNSVKKAVVGFGHASKDQIAHMVRMQMPGVDLDGPDAADALAVALTHAFHLQSTGRLSAALLRAAE